MLTTESDVHIVDSDSERRREEKMPAGKISIDSEVSLDADTHSQPQAGSKAEGAAMYTMMYVHLLHVYIPHINL